MQVPRSVFGRLVRGCHHHGSVYISVLYGGLLINRLCLFVQKRQRSRGGSIPAGPPFTGAAGNPCPLQRRRRGSRGPSSACQFVGCVVRTRTMRGHVTLVHLHPVFRRSVPTEAGAGLRYRVLLWLAHHLLVLRWRTWPEMFLLVRSYKNPRLACHQT